MAGMVHGLQMLLDAALAHGRLEQILELLVPRLCEVLSAEAATIFLTDEDTGELVLRATSGGLPEERVVAHDRHIAARVAESRSPLLVNNPPDERPGGAVMRGMASVISVPLTAGEDVTGVIQVGRPGAAGVRRRQPAAARPGRRPRGAGDRPLAGVRARAPDRRDAPAQPAARAAAGDSGPGGGGALHPGGQRVRGRRRLVRRDPDRLVARGARDGRRGGQGPGGGLDGRAAALGPARLRARGPRARRRDRQPEPAGVVRGRGQRDGHAGVRGRGPGGETG